MSNKCSFFKLLKNSYLNNSLCYNKKLIESLEKNSNEKINENIFEKIIDQKEFEKYYNDDKLNRIKLLYIFRNKIHKILYSSEKIINIDGKIEQLSYYFYLCLLIKENEDFTNYEYQFEYIRQLNIQRESINNKYKKIIMSKIILDLINNYIGFYQTNEDKEIQEKKNENIKIITDNNNIFKKELYLEWGPGERGNPKNNIELKKIDELYVEIIEALIIKNKFEDYKYIYNIINVLDLESIDITEYMINSIINILDKNNEYMKNYMISKIEDLSKVSIINFYYILLKYILKDSLVIYQVKILLEARTLIIKHIKKLSNIIIFNNNENNDNGFNNRKNYIIERLIDSQYYIDKINKCRNINIVVLNKLNIKDNNKKDKNNQNNKESQNIIYINTGNSSSTKEKNEINEFNSKENDKSEINYSTKTNNNKLITINDNESFINNNDKSNTINQSSNNENHDYKINNNTSHISFKRSSNISYHKVVKITSFNEDNNDFSQKRFKDYKIFKSFKIIGNHKTKINTKIKKNHHKKVPKISNESTIFTADFIIEKTKGFISGGNNNILNIYNESYEKQEEINNLNYYIYNLIESNNSLIYGFNNKLYIYDNNNKKKSKQELTKMYINSNFLFLLEINDIFFIYLENKVIIEENINNKIITQKPKYINIKLVKSMIKLKNNYVAFKSVDFFSNNKSILYFYDYHLKRLLLKEIKGYSFIYSPNGLSVMHRENDSENQILLCACKKYFKHQKNGILLIDYKDIDKGEIYSYFYDTKNFEVYCFCQILLFQKEKILKEEMNITYTDYFLVGGFDKNKSKGLIKLFKLVYDETNDNKINYIKIQYMQDINFYNEYTQGINQN